MDLLAHRHQVCLQILLSRMETSAACHTALTRRCWTSRSSLDHRETLAVAQSTMVYCRVRAHRLRFPEQRLPASLKPRSAMRSSSGSRMYLRRAAAAAATLAYPEQAKYQNHHRSCC